MKIIKTSQFEHAMPHHHHGHKIHEDFPSDLAGDEHAHEFSGHEDLTADVPDENPIADINVQDRDGDVQVDGLGDLGDNAMSFGMDDQGHLGLDLGLDSPLEPGVGPDIPEEDLGPDGMLDVELHVDPHPAEDQLPLDVEVDGHELPLDGLTEDHNDPALGLDQIEGEDEYEGYSPHSHPHPHDGVAEDSEIVDDDGQGAEHHLDEASLLGHEPDMGDDAGLEGLLVIDDGKNSAMGSL